jgi:FkbM family methyltransferase
LNREPKNKRKRIIYDIGANNGDDIPYYLKKADLVVAVEANPNLCRIIEERFKSHVLHDELIVCNCVLLEGGQSGSVPFYIHTGNHVLSQFLHPEADLHMYQRVDLPAKSVAQLFHEYGFPYYVKIDIEHYDHVILRAMFENGIVPAYISAEVHNIEVFLLLACLGGYDSYKLVEGKKVSSTFKNHSFRNKSGEEITYSFPHHSAGPFGEDIVGRWHDSEELFRMLKKRGVGWRDIHAKKGSAGYLQLDWNLSQLLKYRYYRFRWRSRNARKFAQRLIHNTVDSRSRN